MPARRVTDYRRFERTYHLLSRTLPKRLDFLYLLMTVTGVVMTSEVMGILVTLYNAAIGWSC